ncbi:DUF359 domain-containing protein [Candidatus Bathyarchaeota archaeon]|nr:DUF359 domain-containing protein [Candidatus Bathyarchaeota archaeon]
MRTELKTPLGLLLKGEPAETVRELTKLLSKCRPPLFASVGDYVSGNVLAVGLEPDLLVVDHRIMRVNVDPVVHGLSQVTVVNPAGTIQEGAWRVLEEAITLKRKLAVVVEGEEDLLVLPLMVSMPTGSVIVYGQPLEGLVVVTVTEERRSWARGFMDRMQEKSS